MNYNKFIIRINIYDLSLSEYILFLYLYVNIQVSLAIIVNIIYLYCGINILEKEKKNYVTNILNYKIFSKTRLNF